MRCLCAGSWLRGRNHLLRTTTPPGRRRSWIRPVIPPLRIARSTNGGNVKSQCGRTWRSSFRHHTSKRPHRGCLLYQHCAHIHIRAPLQAQRTSSEKTFGTTPTDVTTHTRPQAPTHALCALFGIDLAMLCTILHRKRKAKAFDGDAIGGHLSDDVTTPRYHTTRCPLQQT